MKVLRSALAAIPLLASFTPVAAGPPAEEADILLATLNVTAARWRATPPCVVDALQRFESEHYSGKTLSAILGDRVPLRVCPRGVSLTRGDRFFQLSVPVVRGPVASVRMDYICGLCGEGVIYGLR